MICLDMVLIRKVIPDLDEHFFLFMSIEIILLVDRPRSKKIDEVVRIEMRRSSFVWFM